MIQTLVLICLCFCVGVYSDCGCNKIKRSSSFLTHTPNNNRIEDEAPNKSCAYDDDDDMVRFEGEFWIGTNDPIFLSDRELSEQLVHTTGFYIDKFEVSNAQFDEFVRATKYKTDAEKYGDSFVFGTALPESTKMLYNDARVASAPWWYKINGTSWRQPDGPDGRNFEHILDHPVTHVSFFDATEFCRWKNKRLPTEVEWEIACRGGKKGRLFPWGNKMRPENEHWMNIWQGKFPEENTKDDGYVSTCPVDRFRQNDYDLFNMVGNVWEWTDTNWDDNETAADPRSGTAESRTVEKVKKGGSYLCHKSYCYRYRCAARSSNTADSSASNLGFRCAKGNY